MAPLTVTNQFTYDVFLSFRGEDTRYGFTGNLKKALDDKGVKTFMDEKDLQKGEEITPSLLKAIEDSNMAIVVLSENYASSSFCLQELSKILDSINNKGRCVHPVFYKVDPSDVRKLRYSYGKAMAKHEGRCCWPVSNPNVDKWKASLHQVANLSGSHYKGFRGEDTRYGFTFNLKKALDDKGYRTFMDYTDLQKGEDITPSLLHAIENSKIAIVVLSKNYASSSLCLQELSKILDTMKGKVGRSVLPVFYKVDPSDVRKLKKTYEKAMEIHQASSNLDIWKLSLHQVASLSGFHYKKGEMYEHEFIGKIVEQVLRIEKSVALPIVNYLVGPEHTKKHVISLLNVGSDDTIHMVGIHGIGGIGKTMLAIEVYNSIVHQFHGSCFLENVRENSNKNGLIDLQKILLSQIVGEKNIKIASVGQGISILKQMLHHKKVLLLLDDVDNLKQLEAVAGRSANFFGPGSRVIITTRDKRLLTRHEVEITYEVKGLNDEDAFDLVGWKAYGPSYKDILSIQKYGKNLMDVNVNFFSSYAYVLKRAVAYASGHPLALEVIGSVFFGKTTEECECVLDRYEVIPHKEIQQILQLSYDSLQKKEKIVFLDIACFFNGWKLTRVEQILHAHHGDIMNDHINVLVEKSLIKISESGNVTLHNLVEAMGREIVRQESPKDPGKRSRLWSTKDIIHVLLENRGTSNIEIIDFNCWTKISFDAEVFKKMKNLKTLIIRHADFSEISKHLPNSLRVLECCNRKYPSSNPFEWKGFLTKKLQNMRILNLDNSERLAQIPDISGLPNLEEFSIQNGEELIAIDKSVGFLGNLKILRIIKCPKIIMIPSLMLPSLEELDLSDCTRLKSFPPVLDGFGDKLKTMSVRGCHNLRSIPPLKLDSLEILDLSNCRLLESFPFVVDGLLDKLKFLNIEYCVMLRSIPPLRLTSLEQFNLSYCPSLESFPEILGEMRNIPRLLLDETPIEKLPFPFFKSHST